MHKLPEERGNTFDSTKREKYLKKITCNTFCYNFFIQLKLSIDN